MKKQLFHVDGKDYLLYVPEVESLLIANIDAIESSAFTEGLRDLYIKPEKVGTWEAIRILRPELINEDVNILTLFFFMFYLGLFPLAGATAFIIDTFPQYEFFATMVFCVLLGAYMLSIPTLCALIDYKLFRSHPFLTFHYNQQKLDLLEILFELYGYVKETIGKDGSNRAFSAILKNKHHYIALSKIAQISNKAERRKLLAINFPKQELESIVLADKRETQRSHRLEELRGNLGILKKLLHDEHETVAQTDSLLLPVSADIEEIENLNNKVKLFIYSASRTDLPSDVLQLLR